MADAYRLDDLDAEGFGYWPEEAQQAILRRDAEIVRLLQLLQARGGARDCIPTDEVRRCDCNYKKGTCHYSDSDCDWDPDPIYCVCESLDTTATLNPREGGSSD